MLQVEILTNAQTFTSRSTSFLLGESIVWRAREGLTAVANLCSRLSLLFWFIPLSYRWMLFNVSMWILRERSVQLAREWKFQSVALVIHKLQSVQQLHLRTAPRNYRVV